MLPSFEELLLPGIELRDDARMGPHFDWLAGVETFGG